MLIVIQLISDSRVKSVQIKRFKHHCLFVAITRYTLSNVTLPICDH
jgi:hypothetical protein